MGIDAVPSICVVAGARTELCSLRRHLFRDSPSAIEGCAHVRCGTADRTPDGRGGGIGLHHDTHAGARAGGIEFDWSALTERRLAGATETRCLRVRDDACR